jgi:hypothetical protein
MPTAFRSERSPSRAEVPPHTAVAAHATGVTHARAPPMCAARMEPFHEQVSYRR